MFRLRHGGPPALRRRSSPNEERLSIPHALSHLLDAYGYALIGAVLLFEAMGLPLPGESLLVGAALYAGSTHRLDVNAVVLAAATGAILGDNAGYAIGRAIGPGLLRRHGSRIFLTPRRLDAGERLFARHGAKVVLFGRFVGVLRTFAALLAGANRMPWPKFLAANAAGGVLWTCLYGYGANLLGERVKQVTLPLGLAIGAAAAVAILVARRQAKKTGLA